MRDHRYFHFVYIHRAQPLIRIGHTTHRQSLLSEESQLLAGLLAHALQVLRGGLHGHAADDSGRGVVGDAAVDGQRLREHQRKKRRL
jgi:hypothetical protein